MFMGGRNALLLEFGLFVYVGTEFLRFKDGYLAGQVIYVCIE